MKLKAKWLTLMLMIVMVFAACGKKATQDEVASPSSEPTVTQEATATEEPNASEKPNATEELNVTEETSTISKVVSFSPSITEIIYALDAGDILVGRTDYCDYPEQALEVESIGDFYNPDMEKIIELDPDVVIASALWTDDIAAKFEEAKIQVIVLNEASTIDDVYTIITSLGQTLNKEENATQLVEGMKNDLEELTQKISSVEPKSVYYVVGYGEYGDYTATGETYINQMLALAGGDNIAKDATGWTYNLETLIEQDPEVIIIGESMIDDFVSQKNYKDLSAVKNNQVFGIDSNLVDRQTNRTIEGIRTIATILHPEAFTE